MLHTLSTSCTFLLWSCLPGVFLNHMFSMMQHRFHIELLFSEHFQILQGLCFLHSLDLNGPNSSERVPPKMSRYWWLMSPPKSESKHNAWAKNTECAIYTEFDERVKCTDMFKCSNDNRINVNDKMATCALAPCHRNVMKMFQSYLNLNQVNNRELWMKWLKFN